MTDLGEDGSASDGLTFALTPVQLAAILNGYDISHSATLGNRLWGAAGLAFGVIQLVGAAGMFAASETGVGFAGGVILGAHSIDTLQASGRQVWTGRLTADFTQQGTAALARELGASNATADDIGMGVDIAVPFAVGLAAGALRVAAIGGGRISLEEMEAKAGSRIGGHTIARHVGLSAEELQARMERMTADFKAGRIKNLPEAASSFKDLGPAERVLYRALEANKREIELWSKTAVRNDVKILVFDAGQDVGIGALRGSGNVVKMSRVRIVLKLKTYANKPYYILTAFPIP